MKKLTIIMLLCVVATGIWGQQAKKEIMHNPYLSASNYLAYPGPQKELTKAPKGYLPFYISHYGRHGSRYLIGENEYPVRCRFSSAPIVPASSLPWAGMCCAV